MNDQGVIYAGDTVPDEDARRLERMRLYDENVDMNIRALEASKKSALLEDLKKINDTNSESIRDFMSSEGSGPVLEPKDA